MSFEDVAERMKDRRRPTRAERLHDLWTGEESEIGIDEHIEPVTPAARAKTLVAAYALMLLGIVIMIGGAVGLVFLWDTASRLELRGLYIVVMLGIALVVQSVRLFTAVDGTAPLPQAVLKE